MVKLIYIPLWYSLQVISDDMQWLTSSEWNFSRSVAQSWPWNSQITSNNSNNLILNQKSQNDSFEKHRNQRAILIVCITKSIKSDNRCGALLRNIICREISSKDLTRLNSFVPNAPFLYPLKTSEKWKVFYCFQGVEKWCIGKKWVNFHVLKFEKKKLYLQKHFFEVLYLFKTTTFYFFLILNNFPL